MIATAREEHVALTRHAWAKALLRPTGWMRIFICLESLAEAEALAHF
ncbi:hypothetical protein [Falsiroseomonas sp. E2-1-a20]